MAAIAPGAGRLVLVSLSDGQVMDWAAASRDASAAAGAAGQHSAAGLARSCCSGAAWLPGASVALVNRSGLLGVAALPGMLERMGLPPASGGAAPQRRSTGMAEAVGGDATAHTVCSGKLHELIVLLCLA
jgi:hypothetical protein